MKKNENKNIENEQNFCVNKKHSDMIDSRVSKISNELKNGFNLMKKYPKSVTIFGSARLPENNEHSKNATKIAESLSKKGYTIVTGGGYGVMRAANKGAYMVSGPSIGINIELPFEQHLNKYTSDSMEFDHFYTRKVTLAYSAEAYIYFAGGFGTLDELFELLTLKQTKKIPNIPIILFGSEFWKPLEKFFKETLLKNETISKADFDLYIITDDVDDVIKIVEKSKIRGEILDRFCIANK